MLKLICILFISICSMLAHGQVRVPKQDTPRNTLEELFRSARTGDFRSIHLLCDPEGEGDGDTKDLCNLNSQKTAVKAEFRKFFKLAYSFKANRINDQQAEVKFMFGPKAARHETMRLVKRKSKWYLVSF